MTAIDDDTLSADSPSLLMMPRRRLFKRADAEPSQSASSSTSATSDSTTIIVLGVAGALVTIALALLCFYLFMRYRQLELERALLAERATNGDAKHKAKSKHRDKQHAADGGATKSQTLLATQLTGSDYRVASASSKSHAGLIANESLPPSTPSLAADQPDGGDNGNSSHPPPVVPRVQGLTSSRSAEKSIRTAASSTRSTRYESGAPGADETDPASGKQAQQPPIKRPSAISSAPSTTSRTQQRLSGANAEVPASATNESLTAPIKSTATRSAALPKAKTPQMGMGLPLAMGMVGSSSSSNPSAVQRSSSALALPTTTPPSKSGHSAPVKASTSPALQPPSFNAASKQEALNSLVSVGNGGRVTLTSSSLARSMVGTNTGTTGHTTSTATRGITTMNTLITPGQRVVAVPGYLKLPPTCYTTMKSIGDGGEGAIWKAFITDETMRQLGGTEPDSTTDLAVRVRHFERESVRVAGRRHNDPPREENAVIVAVKITKVADNQSVYPGEVLDKFYQELSILSTLQNHPNIVELVGYCDDGVLALIMKMYYANLKSLLYAKGEFEVLPIFDFSADLASALAEMHNNGIIHCDLKSPNLLVDHDGTRLKVVVTDFGVSQVESAFEQVHMRINVVVDAASFSYAAPEVLERFFADDDNNNNGNASGKQPKAGTTVALYDEAEPSRDIYAVAVIIWEMLAKELAFVNVPAVEIYHQVAKENKRPPLPFDWKHASSENMRQAWRRYEQKLGAPAVEALARLVQICWSTESERRLSATVLCEWIGDIRKSHNV